MKLEQTACCLCGSAAADPWAAENGYTMVKCRDCGLVYLNPRPAAEDIDEAARTGMHKFGDTALNVVGRFSKRKVALYQDRLRALVPDAEFADERLAWLDVGAGYGELVAAVRTLANRAAHVEGVEPCEPKVQKARALGMPVSARPLASLDRVYTHISLINVFSHLPDPVAFLRQLSGLLVSKGNLLIVTGNAGDIPRDEFPGSLYLPDHLIFAGEENVKTALREAGFHVAATRSFPDTPSFDNALVTALKNVARRVMGKAPVPHALPAGSRFRSLWIYAQKRQ